VTEQNDKFPFQLSDVVGWMVRHKNGVTVKFNLVSAEDIKKQATGIQVFKPGGSTYKWPSQGRASYSAWCNHEPHPNNGDLPIFQSEGIALWIGDIMGAPKSQREFDFCIDGGNVLTIPGEHDLPVLYGDPALSRNLARFLQNPPKKADHDAGGPRILKIRWYDRAAPPVKPEFWASLLKELRTERDKRGMGDKDPLRVMTICQGGHGRSGSAAAALMMHLSDYTPLDALTHIRAMHCPRAIESKVQHEYLDTVAAALGRTQDALEAENVPSFKDRLLTMKSDYAKTAQERLKKDRSAGAVREDRDGAFC
jgi:hypothetical protein